MYDVIVIGAGPAGYEVATLLANEGKNVCIIEENDKQIGGTCLNEGCIPAKNFLESATFVKKMKYFKSCGVNATLDNFDINTLKTSTNELMDTLRVGIQSKLKKANVSIKYGMATFITANKISIGTEEIEAKNIIIASGSIHKEHLLLPLKNDKIISSKEAFTLKSLPKSILIVGGGAIGCEFATFFNSLGTKVDIAEYTNQLLPSEDEDIAKALKREFEKQSIKIHLNTKIKSHNIQKENIEIVMDIKEKEKIEHYEMVLVSIGRVPNTKNLNTEAINLNIDNNFIEVHKNFQSTSHNNIYAIGDVIKTPALAHVAYYEAKCATNHIINNTPSKDSHIPFVTFCQPQVASVGKNEKTLKQENTPYKIKKQFFKLSAKAKIKGDDSGFVKILYDEQTNQILGASIIGNDATELIHQLLIAINSKLTIKNLQDMIFAHPTISESIFEALSK